MIAMKSFGTILAAVRMTFFFGERIGWKYAVLCAVLSAVFFGAMFSIPVAYTPGNSAAFQAKLYAPGEYVLLGALSFLSGLVLTMQWRIFSENGARERKLGRAAGEAALGGFGVLSGVISSLFATASCGLCVGAIFSFLGFGSVLFLVEHRWYILALAFLLLLASLHFSSKRLIAGCDSCSV